MRRSFEISLKIIFVLVFGCIAGIVLFAGDHVSFFLRERMTTPILSHWLAGLIALALIVLLVKCTHLAVFEDFLNKYGRILLLSFSASLFLIHLLICYHAHFSGNGDDVFYVFNTAYSFGWNYPPGIENAYMELYPNNLSISFLYGLIIRFLRVILHYEAGIERIRVIIIILQALENVLCGIMISWFSFQLTGKRLLSAAAWCLYLFLIGLSPWFLVPYSDSTLLIAPICLLELYQFKMGKPAYLTSMLFGLLGGVCYLIKPQAFIPVIAVIILEVIKVLRERSKKRLFSILITLLCVILVIRPGFDWICRTMGADLDSEESLGAAHYFNMGLNPETDGSFSPADVEADRSYYPKKNRIQYCLRNALVRIQEFGVFGIFNHIVHKTLNNYWDGTFSWNLDFDMQFPPEKDPVLTPLTRDCILPYSKTRESFATISLVVWMTVLFLILFSVKAQNNNPLLLSGLGIAAFNLLFEAKGRYIYIFVPVLILLAIQGLDYLISKKINNSLTKS